jgi:hypothetical protein
MSGKDLRRGTMAGAVLVSMAVAGLSAVPAEALPAAAQSTRSLATIQVRPAWGPAGTLVTVRGTGFYTLGQDGCDISISFTDASGSKTTLGRVLATARFKTTVSIPAGAAPGPGTVDGFQLRAHHHPFGGCFSVYGSANALALFTVTVEGRWSL